MSKGTLALAMIAKNEESIIGQCLESIKDIVSEMIVVDTGSTDRTKEIALSYGAKVVDFPWIDDFSAARNEGLKHVTSDFILMLDADEIIPESSKRGLHKILEENDKSKVYNVNIDNVADGGDNVRHYNFRLFPKHEHIKFVNRIHESLQMGPMHKTAAANDVVIVHYGYLNAQKIRKGTNERNLRILLKEVQDDPNKSHMYYYIAQQYLLNNDYDKSLEYYKRALVELDDKQKNLNIVFKKANEELASLISSGKTREESLKLLTPDKQDAIHKNGVWIETGIFTPLIYVGMTKIYQQKDDIASMLELSKVEINSPDFYVELGTFFFNKKKFLEAITMYEKALDMRDSKSLSCAYDEGSLSWKPYAGLGNVYMAMGVPRKAVDNFKLALTYKPDNSQLLKVLYEYFVKSNNLKEAEPYIKELSKVEPSPQTFINLANLYMNTRREGEAMNYYLKYADIEALLSLQAQLAQNKNVEYVEIIKKHLKDNKLILSAPYRSSKQDQVTVIIPTLLKASVDMLKYSIEQLEKNELVKQIIIIDNRQEEELKSLTNYLPESSKIKIIYDQPDLFVNPAWNYGMSLCDTPYYLLLNDDVLCHTGIINDCYNVLENDASIGLLQVVTSQQDLKAYTETTTRYDNTMVATNYFIQNAHQMMGWFMFGRKEDWIAIPEQLKYFFGDNLLYIHNQLKKKKIAKIVSKHIAHALSTTVNSLELYKKGLLDSEKVVFDNVLKEILPPNTKVIN